MNFLPLTDLYDALAPAAPGLNEDTALDELRRAARTFARESLASQETLELDILADDRSIFLDAPSASVSIVRALWVEASYGPIEIVTLLRMNQASSGWRTATGDPTMCTTEVANELVLNRAPTATVSGVQVRIACMPSLTATELDAFLVNELGEALIDGALSRILRMPGQTWTDRAAAIDCERRFENEMLRAKTSAVLNRSNAQHRPPLRRWC